MEENGNMIWNSETGYLEYKVALDSLMSRLGIGITDFIVRPELSPYLTRILIYLNQQLVLLGDDAEMSEKLQKMFDIFDHGAELIIADSARNLAEEIGQLDESDEIVENTGEEEEENEYYVPYDQDRFIFSWTNVLSSLITRLKIQYANLLVDEVSTQGCGCCCAKGESYKDWESYRSGVWSDEEEYNSYDLGNSTSTWRVGANISQCGCGYRKV